MVSGQRIEHVGLFNLPRDREHLVNPAEAGELLALQHDPANADARGLLSRRKKVQATASPSAEPAASTMPRQHDGRLGKPWGQLPEALPAFNLDEIGFGPRSPPTSDHGFEDAIERALRARACYIAARP